MATPPGTRQRLRALVLSSIDFNDLQIDRLIGTEYMNPEYCVARPSFVAA